MTKTDNPIFDLELKIGMTLYETDTPGVKGILRHRPEDFYVEEISDIQVSPVGTGNKSLKYLVFELTKNNWDTNHFLKALSNSLGISHKRISYAGTKDKRAVTVQKMSVYDVSEEALNNVSLKDISIRVLGKSQNPVALGDLDGNLFKITLRNIDFSPEETLRMAEKTTLEIAASGGVPNFFGIQRFGTKRPMTHLVGQDILSGNLEKAVMRYIAESYPDESEETKAVRNYILETNDLKGGLAKMPDHLGHEKALLNHLIAYPGDYKGAFMVLPKNLYTMFVHAYQSYLFNQIICKRLEAGLLLNRAEIGDIVCYRRGKIPDPDRLETVDAENREGINNLLRRKRAFITAPLFGSETPLAGGIPGEIERSVIEMTGFSADDFKVPAFPETASKGLRKEILLEVEPTFLAAKDDDFPEKTALTLHFSLPKGSYATTVLREYMKTDPLDMS
ncbi:tRNA pseudouridine(13) synthase TruD [Methanolapillus millepedarum]|uniref:Probable tRNA pseudouridine synthase D n=1 Tax=Methanolapillus millepedarum TaxID=3028296 RepID=A0AA96V1I1_9EURY|nr:tRNA pseudouridine synthase D [Methanosarcinaceae archaeon Ac7]